jgi:hypothetical protein
MKKIFNFIVLLILIKQNTCEIKDKGELMWQQNTCEIKDKGELIEAYSIYKYRKLSYYFNNKFFGKIIFCKIVWKDSISYEVLKDECKFEISNWQAKLLYKMAQNKSKINL